MKSLNNIIRKNILVIGDIMLDKYYNGEVKRISPEAPVPVFSKKGEKSVLGGAANVAANLVSALQNVYIMAVIGNDESGNKLKTILKKQGIKTDFIIYTNKHTTEKIRFLASNNQQVLRLDIEDTRPLNSDDCTKMLHDLNTTIKKFDLIILSDYLKGVLTYEFTQGVIKIARENNIPVIIDVKDLKIEKYKDAYLIKPNLKELENLSGMPVSNDKEIIEASRYLKNICNCRYILTTCGARGMVLVGDSEPYFIKSASKEVFDVTGAGDTTIAYLAACIVNGFTMKESVNIANYAAGIQVSKVGTSSVYWEEIRKSLYSKRYKPDNKLISGKLVDDFRKNNADKKIVFTNGCFDIIHAGHVNYLQEAANLGDILVVGLNSDMSVKKLKGPERPINTELERARIMCSLEYIDYVVIFEEETPLDLIKKIQPDVLAKGGDYSNKYVVGKKEVEANGGIFVLIPFTEGQSTTNIIKKIQNI